MPKIDLSMLNQRQTPAFYADVLANRPAAGFIGRIFVSTNTYAFYRDNGTGWDLIGGPGTGTVTGSGTAGQVTYWDGASSITGSNNLFWDSAAGHLGINNNTPGTGLDVHDSQSTILQLNQTTSTNDTRIAFQNAGTSLWRIGNFYNAGANDWGIYDVVGAAQPLTIKKTTGQVLIGTSTVGAGKLVVSSASADNGVQVVGASAPSLRIDNAATGATKRAGLGISTSTNNFIQGSADRDFCIFNGSTAAASPILFGVYDAGAVNVQEAARISAARNFLIGTTTDSGYKLNVNGTGTFNGDLLISSTILQISSSSSNGVRMKFTSTSVNGREYQIGSNFVTGTGEFAIYDLSAANARLTIASTGAATFSSNVTTTNGVIQANSTGQAFKMASLDTTGSYFTFSPNSGSDYGYIGSAYHLLAAPNNIATNFAVRATANLILASGGTNPTMLLTNSYNVLIGTTTDGGQKLQVNGTALFSGKITVSSTNTDGLQFGSVSRIRQQDASSRIEFVNADATAFYDIAAKSATFSGAINIGNTVTAAVGIASTHKVSILINGVQYYLLASNV